MLGRGFLNFLPIFCFDFLYVGSEPMANLSSYEGIISSIESAQKEVPKDAIQLLKEIEGLVSSKIRSKKAGLTQKEKEEILSILIPEAKEAIESKLNQENGKVRSKGKSKSKSVEIEVYDHNDYAFDFEVEEEENLETDSTPTWESINPDNLTYPEWLYKVGLPEFFGFENELLHKLAACICLIHSAAIPGTQRDVITKAELPKIICYGPPGIGKSTFGDWVGNHYQREDGEYDAFQTVLEGDSYKGLRDALDRACNLGEGVLREACIHVDDFEPKFIGPGGVWYKGKSLFINVVRSQAISRVSVNGNKERDAQSIFYSWALMLLTMNNHPKELFTLAEKMERRCLILPFAKMGRRSLGEFSWGNLRSEYKKIWTKEGIEKIFWRQILRPLLKRPFSQFKKLDQMDIARSVLIMAVGTYTGIFSCLEEAEEYMAEYWTYIREKTSEGYEDLFLTALEQYINQKESEGETLTSRLGRSRRYIEIDQDSLLNKVSGVSALSPKEKESRLLGFIRLRGYSVIQKVNSQGEYKNYFLKYLDGKSKI